MGTDIWPAVRVYNPHSASFVVGLVFVIHLHEY